MCKHWQCRRCAPVTHGFTLWHKDEDWFEMPNTEWTRPRCAHTEQLLTEDLHSLHDLSRPAPLQVLWEYIQIRLTASSAFNGSKFKQHDTGLLISGEWVNKGGWRQEEVFGVQFVHMQRWWENQVNRRVIRKREPLTLHCCCLYPHTHIPIHKHPEEIHFIHFPK